MSTIVIMPGGFHPFHAGHAALYQSAVQAFPGAEVFVAATNDTSNRPFPFAIKEKLAKLAGVAPGHFVQVKSPFRAEEITSQFDPAKDRLIFVRSEKDANKPPQAGGTKKDGSPAYLQLLAGQTNIRPFAEHAYMAYLPTVEFGPGMTSATEIRTAWPQLNEKRKTALVMSLYPQTQSNPKLAANVVKMLDTAIGAVEEMSLAEKINPDTLTRGFRKEKDMGWYTLLAVGDYKSRGVDDPPTIDIIATLKPQPGQNRGQQIGELNLKIARGAYLQNNPGAEALVAGGVYTDDEYQRKGVATSMYQFAKELGNDVIASYDQSDAGKAMWAGMRQKGMEENQGWAATFTSEESGQMAGTPAIGGMWAGYQQRDNQPIDEDYIDEKWSQKYKSSINCANPKGFSQRAHCAGRKKK